MRTGVIIVTNAGHVAAESYLEQALANNPSCAGIVVHTDDKGLIIERTTNMDIDTLKKMTDGLKDNQINIFLGKFRDGFLPEDIQPFVLVEDKDGKPVVACMIDGDWVTTASGDSNHTDEYHTATQVLKPMFEQLYRLTKGDINAMIEEVQSEATSQSIKNTFINTGVVHLMFNNGHVHTIVKNDHEKEFKWGWVSDFFMYSEDKKPEPEKNILSAFMSSVLPKAEPTLIKDPPAEYLGDLPVGNVKFDKDPVLPKAVSSGPPANPEIIVKDGVKYDKRTNKPLVGEMWSCPRSTVKAHKVEGAYKHNCNWVPPNYMSYPTVEVRPKPALPPVDLKKLTDKFGKTETRILPDVGSTKEDIAQRQPPKQITGPKIIAPVQPLEQPPKLPETPVPEPKKDVIPSMSPESQKQIVDTFLKATEKLVNTTDLSGKPIVDPRDAPSYEAKYASFCERIGITEDELFRWKVERFSKLLNEFPDAMLHLTMNLLQDYAKLKKTADAKKIVLPKAKTG